VTSAIADLVAEHTLDVPDYPKPGIMFKDLSPLFLSGPAFAAAIDAVASECREYKCSAVAGIEARGFVIAAAVAYATGLGVVPIRKAGKLPRKTYRASYSLEYGEATVEMHQDAVEPGQRVMLVDDVLATGGTAEAAISLIKQAGGVVGGLNVFLELGFLAGRQRLSGTCPDVPVTALLTV
jgi:adenine phosphoribosyltransferase